MRNNIFLIDMDNFFASCEVIDQKLDDSIPIVICEKYARSVVCSCNQKAKDLGIHAAMPLFQAQAIYPQLKIVPSSMSRYDSYAQKIETILLSYTKEVTKISIDEWELDFSKSNKFYNEVELAEFIKSKIFRTLGLKCSIGISTNFFNAKTASKFAKPFGVFLVNDDNFEKVIWPIQIEKMHMCGKKTSDILKSMKINTIGDLAKCNDEKILIDIIGKNFSNLLKSARNIQSQRSKTKNSSVASSRIFLQDTADYDEIMSNLKDHFRTLYRKIIINSKLIKTVSIELRTSRGIKRKQFSYKDYTDDEGIIWNQVKFLFEDIWNNALLRGVGISFGNIINFFEHSQSLNLFEEPKTESLVNIVNRKLGFKAVEYASILKDSSIHKR